MNKKYYFLSYVILLLCTLTLSSCISEDEQIAYNLEGVWQGEIRDGRDRYDVTMAFEIDGNDYNGMRGRGYEIDRGWYSRNTEVGFSWVVRGGNIYIVYDDGTRVVVDYDRLPYTSNRGERFAGYFVDWYSNETLAEFYLVKVDSYMAKKQNTLDTKNQ